MTAEVLREAAALMRSRAEAATPSPWLYDPEDMDPGIYQEELPRWIVTEWGVREPDATHIASWHPAVALAVADWLDATAVRIEAGKDPVRGGRRNHGWRGSREALAVARTYLGSDA